MQVGQQVTTNIQDNDQGFYSARSETLNPEFVLNRFQSQEEDNKLLTLTSSKARKRIRQSCTTTKHRLTLSGNTQKPITSETNRTFNKISFQPRPTISSMVRDRHKIQSNTQKLSNYCNYLSVRLRQKSIKKQISKQKQMKIKETIDTSKQEKKFVQRAIRQHSQTVYVHKLNSRSQVLGHRKSLRKIIDLKLIQKKTKGDQGRRQTALNHYQIERIKNNWLQENKQAVQRGRSLQQILHQQKLQRQHEKRMMAKENYKNKWMQQFMQKQRIERQNKLKSRKLNRKIKYLLEQSRKLESSLQL